RPDRIPRMRILALILCLLPPALAAAPASGEAIYQKRCASCHEQPATRAPQVSALKSMSARRILRTLDAGAMMTVAYPMGREEREAVAGWLGTKNGEAAPPAAAFCADRRVTVSDSAKAAWNGWSPSFNNARFQSAEAAGLTIAQLGRLKL